MAGMKPLVILTAGCIACGAVSASALQAMLDRRAIEEAIYIGQSRIELERSRFHVPYRVRVAKPPIDWIDVITPFHKVELASEANARAGGRMFSQIEALKALGNAPTEMELLIEMSFHPQNTFVAVPLYDPTIVTAGGRRVSPQRVERFPHFGPRPESAGPALPTPNAGTAFGAGQPVVGGTILVALDGSAFEPKERIEVVVMDGKNELARVTVDLATMR